MAKVHLIHGFNVSDGGKGSVGRLKPYIEGSEISHDYGWTGLLMLRCNNQKAIKQILPKINPGDILIGHSNGALICYELAEILGDVLGGVVVINPAMRRDTIWPGSFPILCIHNHTDWVVNLGRVWARLVSLGSIQPHGWGAAGRYGFTHDRRVNNLDSAEPFWEYPAKGHSGIFCDPQARYWGHKISNWINMIPDPGG